MLGRVMSVFRRAQAPAPEPIQQSIPPMESAYSPVKDEHGYANGVPLRDGAEHKEAAQRFVETRQNLLPTGPSWVEFLEWMDQIGEMRSLTYPELKDLYIQTCELGGWSTPPGGNRQSSRRRAKLPPNVVRLAPRQKATAEGFRSWLETTNQLGPHTAAELARLYKAYCAVVGAQPLSEKVWRRPFAALPGVSRDKRVWRIERAGPRVRAA